MRRLKDENIKWLSVIGFVNVVGILWAVCGYDTELISGDNTNHVTEGMTGAVCVAAGVLTSVMGSRERKHQWLFGWKEERWPFSQTFTRKTLDDPTIDEAGLRSKVQPWPESWQAQTRETMRLLRAHEAHPAIADNHRIYLLLRDWAWMSLLLGLAGSAAAFTSNGVTLESLCHTIVLGMQGACARERARTQATQLCRTLLSVASTT